MYIPITLPRLLAGLIVAAALTPAVPAAPAGEDDLESVFRQPPEAARPRTWWHWVSGNVSAEGITADLEAMKEIGLGGCQLFTVDQSKVKGPVKFMSPEWRRFVRQALAEANRLGLEVAVEGCDGWSESGGPWITPAQGMQQLVWTEKTVAGGGKVILDLPQPLTTRGFYRDVAVLAFPQLPGDDLPRPAELKSSAAGEETAKLTDSHAGTATMLKKDRNAPIQLELVYARPVTCSSLLIQGDLGLARFGGRLEASSDGQAFVLVGPVVLNGLSTFPAVTGTHFRLTFPKANVTEFQLAEITLAGPRIEQLAARAGMQAKERLPIAGGPAEAIDLASIVDLTGRTEWEAPPGRWTVLRFGHTGTGKTTHPSTTPGLEADKMSRESMRFHFEQMYGPVFADSPEQTGKAFRFLLLDSWEAGCANWTPLMPREFAGRRGYDLRRWLPVFTGRAVKDAESTQRFLWDFRRTIGELVADCHYGTAREFAREHGLGVYAEAPGIGLPTVADNLACKGRTDIPMGEFWINRSAADNVDDPKEAASAAHVYGQNLAAAEAFTATAAVSSWANDPYGLKALGDMEFCLGINRFVFHRYAHQPWNDRRPGMSMGPWGINFERTNTWWKPGAAWIDYLSRCQSLLQQGRFQADVLYFYGEGAPLSVSHQAIAGKLPPGYDYDACNAEILFDQSSVENGDIVLKSGMRYRVLVLPPGDRLTLPALKKLQALVQAGATVHGPKPVASPSLADDDSEVRKIADELWGDDPKATVHACGRGRVVWGIPLSGILPAAPDFRGPPGLMFIHRRVGDTEIYFVSNQQKVARTEDCGFRVAGKLPELWHPDTGRIEPAALYRMGEGGISLPLHFDPVGSVFVVFRKPAPANPAVALLRDGQPVFATPTRIRHLEIKKATFGIPGDPAKTREATARVRAAVASGALSLPVSAMLKDGDPAYGVVKTLTVTGVVDGRETTVAAAEGEELSFLAFSALDDTGTALCRREDGFELEASVPGTYEISLADGRKLSVQVAPPPAIDVDGPWRLEFPPNLGAPAGLDLEHLTSWSLLPDPGAKHFSGTAIYRKSIELPTEAFGKGQRLYLDLGEVKNLAEVKVNGKSFGVLWKPPFRLEITEAAKPGQNDLEIRVTNLWVNRLVGDQKLPENQRISWASVSPYKADSPLLPSGLLGPVRFIPTQTVFVKQP